MSQYGEPWRVSDCEISFTRGPQILRGERGVVVHTDCDAPHLSVDLKDAERIVACVNFLRAVPTEILQSFPDGADAMALLTCQHYVPRRKLNIGGSP